MIGECWKKKKKKLEFDSWDTCKFLVAQFCRNGNKKRLSLNIDVLQTKFPKKSCKNEYQNYFILLMTVYLFGESSVNYWGLRRTKDRLILFSRL